MNLFVMTWSIKGNFSDLVEPANEHSLTRKVKYENSNKNSSISEVALSGFFSGAFKVIIYCNSKTNAKANWEKLDSACIAWNNGRIESWVNRSGPPFSDITLVVSEKNKKNIILLLKKFAEVEPSLELLIPHIAKNIGAGVEILSLKKMCLFSLKEEIEKGADSQITQEDVGAIPQSLKKEVDVTEELIKTLPKKPK